VLAQGTAVVAARPRAFVDLRSGSVGRVGVMHAQTGAAARAHD
jgi:hypothetical protein